MKHSKMFGVITALAALMTVMVLLGCPTEPVDEPPPPYN
jgi:hypothetical protein